MAYIVVFSSGNQKVVCLKHYRFAFFFSKLNHLLSENYI